jgi:hypothetical protein
VAGKEICDSGEYKPHSDDCVELIYEGPMETEYECSGGNEDVPSTCLSITHKRVGDYGWVNYVCVSLTFISLVLLFVSGGLRCFLGPSLWIFIQTI